MAGPRQVGKTTLAQQLQENLRMYSHYASADEPSLKTTLWIEQQWEIARLRTQEHSQVLLILDEIQKIPGWSDVVKNLWDQDTRHKKNIKILLLGSSALLIQSGLSESLSGRFEMNHVTHWSYLECLNAHGWSVDQYVYFGGYPGAASLIADDTRWARYVLDALIETTISKDIMLISKIQKPALLRRVFELGCVYSGQILSYQKMLGQLQDAGNASTIAHYLELLTSAGLIMGLPKFAMEVVRQKASSPKLQVLNTAIMSAQARISFSTLRSDPESWGRWVESCVGAHLVNSSLNTMHQVSYWKEGSKEVDFIIQKGNELLAIEVKSTNKRTALPGIQAFSNNFPKVKSLLIGGQGIALKEFLSLPITHFI
ncbi:MAG: ATP-binding protein [Gammaproteobacteria bacterium]